jgi:hypothetical protein
MGWHDDQRLSFLLLAAVVWGEGYSSRCGVRLPDSVDSNYVGWKVPIESAFMSCQLDPSQ